MTASNPIIVALDVATAEDAIRLAEQLADHVGGFKVGLGLLHGPGPGVVAALGDMKPVFADAKLHDIPSQVRTAAARLGSWGARWVTAHASGGREMLESAVAGLHETHPGAGVLAVTVLTSLDPQTMQSLWGATPGKMVARLAKVAAAAGCEGVVCSPRELTIVRDAAPGLVAVTPGIRDDESHHDQARTARASDAVAWGAQWVVVGRPIITAADPVQAVRRLADSLQAAD